MYRMTGCTYRYCISIRGLRSHVTEQVHRIILESDNHVIPSYLEFPKWEFPRSGIAGIPIGIPGSKTALFWEFSYRGGSVHTEGFFLHTEGGVLVAFRTGTSQNFLHAAPLVAHLPRWLLVSLPSERARYLKSTITK